MKSLPAAAVGVEEEVPELLSSQHVDEEVGGRVDAGREVGQADDHLEGGRALAHRLPLLHCGCLDVLTQVLCRMGLI